MTTRRSFFGKIGGLLAGFVAAPKAIAKGWTSWKWAQDPAVSISCGPVTSKDIDDLVQATLADLGKARFSDIMDDYRHALALKSVLKKHVGLSPEREK